MMLWLAMFMSLTTVGATPATSRADDDGMVETQPAPAAKSLDSWIDKLGHPQFAVRQEARQALANLGPEHLPDLARRYRSEANREVRHGIQYAAELIFYHQQIKGREGFLGISIAKLLDTSVSDPVTRQPVRGVGIIGVIAGLPAQRGGLRPDDVVIGVDGQAVPKEPTSRGFQNMIGARLPGEVISMRILRPGETTRQVTLTVGERQAKPLLGLKLSPSIGLALGPRIAAVLPDSPAAAAGLQVNETIESIEGQRMTADVATVLDDLLRTTPPGSRLTLGVRACREMTLDVPLGARPAQLLEGEDKLNARAEFLRWWRQHIGEPSPAPQPVPDQNPPLRPGSPTTQESDNSVLP